MAHMLTIHTYDWVPEGPRGFVRDIRLRWAAEEAGLPYRIQSVPFAPRDAAHFARQPFGQVPFLTQGAVTMFESGAGLLHLARQSEVLMPTDPVHEAEVTQWLFAALNSIEMVSVPWWFLEIMGEEDNGLTDWLDGRLTHLEAVLVGREWLAADRFTLADLIMADVLRVPKVRAHGDRPATEAYVQRVLARPAFLKARADQIAHFEKADAERAAAPR